jgi:hypothetical protein
MRSHYIVCFLSLYSIASLGSRRTAAATAAEEVESFLVAGNLAAGRAAMQQRLAANEADDEAQFAVGVVEVLQAVENLTQNLHRYGLKPSNPQLPFVRLPVPKNPEPEPLTYEKWRAVLQEFIDDMESAAESLAKVDDEKVKLKLPVGLMRLDLDGDGEARDDETFWRIFTAVAWRAAKLDEDQQRFEIGFDKADVHWMIGYTHLLRAMAEAWLAYDTREFFAQTAPFFFDGAASPAMQLGRGRTGGFDLDTIADAVAAIHLAQFDLAEPERMAAAREHLLSMIAQSRQVWNFATRETDNDREWIPNAGQTSLTPLTVDQARIDAWAKFLDEAEAVLEGRKLLPHWRVGGDRGINLKRVLTEPRQFDLVLWLHGAAAIPYLEEGPKVSRETALTLSRTFQGRFVVFAVWFQ